MKRNILAIIFAVLSSVSSFASGWEFEDKFDLSTLNMYIDGDIHYTPSGVDLSETTITIFVPHMKVKYDGVSYNLYISNDAKVASGFCEKLGRKLKKYETKSTDKLSSLIILNPDLSVKVVDPGFEYMGTIECN